MNKLWKKIGQKIKSARNQRGWSQSDLGEKIGSSFQFISGLENGRQKCSLDKLDEISRALECKLIIELREA